MHMCRKYAFLIQVIYSQESIEYCDVTDILLIMLGWADLCYPVTI